MNHKEQWKPIPGFPDYEVSNMGRVRSYKWKNRGPNAPHMLKPGHSSGDYLTVVLRRNGKNHAFSVGRLVLLAFRGPCPENCEMCHNDGDPTNDHLGNLRWDTHAANMQDASKHGAWAKSTNDASKHNALAAEPTSEGQMEIANRTFVEAVKREQERRGETQGVFACYLGVSQGALSKFYKRGPKDSVVIKVLRKYPHLVIYFASEDIK